MADRDVTIIHWPKGCEYHNQMGNFLATKIKKCRQIDILTGYFFFDGFQAIQDALNENADITLRILVGMDAGIDAIGLIHEIYEYESSHSSDNCSKKYAQQLKEVLQKWPSEKLTDTQSKAWKHYAEMIHNGHLQIRKTREPNHAKVYIFHPKQGKVSYTSGSSNFSYSGLQGRRELNVHVATDYADEVCDIFEESWNEAVPIAGTDLKEHSTTSEGIEKILKEETPDTSVNPFDAYVKVLYEYMNLQKTDDKLDSRIRKIMREAQFPNGGKIQEEQYQIDAIQRAQNILNVHGGVIIADVVGLGKSIVASVLASLSDAPGIVIAPKALCGEGNWETYLSTFHLEQDGWSCFSYGMIDSIPQNTLTKARTIILDEAHNIRNRKTEAYQNLRRICTGKKIIFLSATPFNNKPDDIYSLVSLISNNTIAGFSKSELEVMFKDFSKQYENIKNDPDILHRKEAAVALSEDIRRIVSRITVRRNRLDLIHEHSPYRETMLPKISKLEPPYNEEFKLSPDISAFYNRILTEYFAGEHKFRGFMYTPELSNGGRNDAGQLFSMICHFVITRWESSPIAFRMTVQNIKRALDASIHLFKSDKGVFFRFSPDYGIDDLDSDTDFSAGIEKEWEEAIPKYKHVIYVDSVQHQQSLLKRFPELDGRTAVLQRPKEFLEGLQKDSKVLQDILDVFSEMNLDNPDKDAKFQCLVENIRNVLAGKYDKGTADEGKTRKVIVFSGFADTAKYVADNLQLKFPGSVMFVSGDSIKRRLNAEEAIEFGFSEKEYHDRHSHGDDLTMRDAVLRNFKFSALPKDDIRKKKWKILVCTDVLSEGIDLNAAGIVFNYDMAYNPVRIIQRLGRINRISDKVFEKLYRVNFFPTTKGENVNNVKKISSLKANLIQELFAEDASILTDDEIVKPAGTFFASSESDSDPVNGPMSEDLQIRGMYEKALEQKCGESEEKRLKYLAKIQNLAGRFSKFRGKEETLLFFFRNTVSVSAIELPHFASQNDADTINISLVEALKKISCDPDCSSIPFHCSENDSVWKAFLTWEKKKFHVSSVKQNLKKYQLAYGIIQKMDLGSHKADVMTALSRNPDFANAVIKEEHSPKHILHLFQTYNQHQVQEVMECFMTSGVLL